MPRLLLVSEASRSDGLGDKEQRRDSAGEVMQAQAVGQEGFVMESSRKVSLKLNCGAKVFIKVEIKCAALFLCSEILPAWSSSFYCSDSAILL